MAGVRSGGRGLYFYRALIALALLGFMWLSITATIAGVARRYQPEIALRFQSFDALANAEYASRLQLDSRGQADPDELMELARTALRRDPTMAQASRVIGLVEAGRGRPAEAARALRYSDRLTRRDIATQLWLIEFYVQRNDVPEVLRHFEAAASSSTTATTILFPVLVNALNQNDLVEPMASMLARQPWWSASLLMAMAQGTQNLDNVADLFVRLARSGAPPRGDIVAIVIQRLITAGETGRAERLPREIDEAERTPLSSRQ
jgi:hypothetical protein